MTAVDVLLEASTVLPAEVADGLRNHLDGAIADLGLPGPTRVRTATDTVPNGAIRVTVNDTQFILGAAPGWEIVASGMHEHRAAWISRAAADQVRARIAPEAEPELFCAAARELVRRGVAVPHLAAAALRADSSDAAAAAEDAMAARTARVVVRLAAVDLQAAPVEPEPLEELADELWRRLGLVLPAVTLEPDPGLAARTV